MSTHNKTLIISLLCFASMQASQAPQAQNQAPKKVAVTADIILVHRCTGQTPGVTFYPPNPQVRLLDAHKQIIRKINLPEGQSISLAYLKFDCPDIDTTQLTSISDYANGYFWGLIRKKITK